jgi:hypothetical protein
VARIVRRLVNLSEDVDFCFRASSIPLIIRKYVLFPLSAFIRVHRRLLFCCIWLRLLAALSYALDMSEEKQNTKMSGHWLVRLIRKYFKKYWEIVGADYLKEVYHTSDREQIANRLTKMFARNAAIIGGFTGVIMSVDEIMTFATGAEGGMGLPFNIAIAVLVLTMETILLLRCQLALVACLGRLYEVPLDPDNPEDILKILAYAIGGGAANAAGTAGIKMGGKLAARVAKTVVQKETLTVLTELAERVGIQMLARAAVKYAVPLVSIGIGAGANYFATRAVGRIAKSHLRDDQPRG